MTLLCCSLTTLLLGVADARTGRMPNALTLGSLVLAIVVRVALEGPAEIAGALAGAAATAAVPLLFYIGTRGRAIGGGDVKALAALGAWLGPFLGLEVEVLSFSLLMIVGLVQQARRGQLRVLFRRTWGFARRSGPQDQDAPGTELRFGPCLSLGTIWGCGATWLSSSSFVPL